MQFEREKEGKRKRKEEQEGDEKQLNQHKLHTQLNFHNLYLATTKSSETDSQYS